MAIKAICVACGKPKPNPFGTCKACGFLPETDYQFARALIFSMPSSDRKKIGRDQESLKALSKQITGGRPYEFDPSEVELALQAYQQLKQANLATKNRLRKTALILIFLLIILAGTFGYMIFAV